AGVVVCADPGACWVDLAGGDLRPRADGPLLGAGPGPAEASRDLCRAARGPGGAAGAIASPDGPPLALQPVSKADSACFAAGYVDPALAARVGDSAPSAGCVSAELGSARGLAWLLLVAALGVRTVRPREDQAR